MHLRYFKSLAIVGALAAFAACNDSTSPGTQLAGGSYALQTVNGSNLPYTYPAGSSTVTIQSDVYTLNNDGSYTETISEMISNGVTSTPNTDSEAGTWVQSGSTVAFAPSYSTQNNYSQYAGTLSASSTFSHSTLTFQSGGTMWVYAHT